MCGRYVLALRPSQVRTELEGSGMPVEEAPEDESTRQSYNVAPGYYELVYRADVPDWGAGGRQQRKAGNEDDKDDTVEAEAEPGAEFEKRETVTEEDAVKETKYKLQAMKWGLIPFWTKRNPDYGSMMRTINCRDDSLLENRGMWNTMKQKKRCIVLCQGFFEWLKKNGGKEKIPHYVKRKDGQLMCFAGLWDCVQYEGSDEKLYTYTIITTSSNEDLKFLHDRMPVILDNGSDAIRTWLDPGRPTWSKELQSLLVPFKGELDMYPVSKDVGKVGNNSPTFVVPVASAENKNNIANFFANARSPGKGKTEKEQVKKEQEDVKSMGNDVQHQPGEKRKTIDHDGSEDNAPLPTNNVAPVEGKGIKREHREDDHKDVQEVKPVEKSRKVSRSSSQDINSPAQSPVSSTRATRSATSNRRAEKSPPKSSPAKTNNGSQKITNFFNK
ncbi:MAG: hypothetical protein M1837_000057 [Sclerophora amabilis]|nr:MAG: hypothetical protein M1837_000057 [Sclerophora amabilis]